MRNAPMSDSENCLIKFHRKSVSTGTEEAKDWKESGRFMKIIRGLLIMFLQLRLVDKFTTKIILSE